MATKTLKKKSGKMLEKMKSAGRKGFQTDEKNKKRSKGSLSKGRKSR